MNLTIDRRDFLVSSTSSVAALIFTGKTLKAQHVEKAENKVYEISEIITERKRIPKPNISAFYKVNTQERFYIVRYKDGSFHAAYDESSNQKNPIFSNALNLNGQLIAHVDASNIGLPGGFEIYSTRGSYSVEYNRGLKHLTPLLYIPSHTSVEPVYVKNIKDGIKQVPEELLKIFKRNNIQIMITEDIDDSYYYYYPSWKTQDSLKKIDPKKPWLERIKNGDVVKWIDNRKYLNVGAIYTDKTAIIPQKYVKYGTNEIIDRKDLKDPKDLFRTIFHELGHALDDIYDFSDTDGFKKAHIIDKKKLSEEEEKKVGYFYNSRSETFAELFAVLLHKTSKEKAAAMIIAFPSVAEHMRTNILPRFNIKLSKDSIQELKKSISGKLIELKDIAGTLIIPDLTQELMPSSHIERQNYIRILG